MLREGFLWELQKHVMKEDFLGNFKKHVLRERSVFWEVKQACAERLFCFGEFKHACAEGELFFGNLNTHVLREFLGI